MKKEDIILNLVRDGKITNEEAKVLLEKVKEYVYINQPYPFYYNTSPLSPPY